VTSLEQVVITLLACYKVGDGDRLAKYRLFVTSCYELVVITC
jgi:hypothetical protein